MTHEKSEILFIKCPDYDRETVSLAFQRLESLVEAHGITLPKETKVILKPNLLAPDPPEKMTTTHPEIFYAAAKLMKKHANSVFYGDSPGMASFAAAAKVSGIADAAEKESIEALDFSKERTVDFCRDGRFCRKFILAECISPEYKIVNLPKLKTHGQMIYTGAIKNIFGCVPGIRKPESHFKMCTSDNFAMMIVDLYMLIRPAFTIMDAVIAMEGNGPRSGNPRKMGFIIAGHDCLAIDSICTKIMGLNSNEVPILKYASEFGAGNIALEKIEIIGDDWKEFVAKDFKNIASVAALNFMGPAGARLFKRFLLNRPAVTPEKCTLCLKCVKECPVDGKAIYRKGGRIEYRYDKCIRCFCCQEICPEGAIYVQESRWWKFLNAFYKFSKR